MNTVPTVRGARCRSLLFSRFRAVSKLAALTASLLGFTAAGGAPLVTPQQLTVTAANAAGGSVYNLNLTVGRGATTALITSLQPINSDGGKHGLFDALVWLPNAFSGTLDLIVADATKGQILRYAGPNYGTSAVIFSYTTKGSGPSNPVGLAVDAGGNLFAISPSNPFDAEPGLWVLPFNKTTGVYGAPVLIDHSFAGARTLALAEVLVAGAPATAVGTASPAWNAGDVLVLVGDTFDSRVIAYSQTAIKGVLAKPTVPLTGPTSTVITSKQFLGLIAAPFGMDVWPADATHGTSLLFTTIDGRIVRFDSRSSAFTANFASGLGLGLQKIKVGTFAGTPYAFVAQLGSSGQILQFGAPPASGANKPLAVLSKGVNAPIGLALSNSGSTSASSCVAPNSCSPLGPNVSTQFSGPGAANIPPGATILEQSCTVPADPRVAVAGGTWSCLGPTINVCGPTPTPGCVPQTLDVANYCPGFPSTILPASMCGHSGASGSAFGVIKSTASLIDQHANDLYIQTSVDATQALPGPYDLPCQSGTGQYGPLLAFAPRSDLPTIEGSIVEDQSVPFFIDFTGLCDRSGGNTHVESMFAYGLGLNTAASGLGSGANGGLYGFVNTKFDNLSATISNSSPQITPQTVTTTLQNYVTQSKNYFDSDYQNDVNGYSCALNSIASADVYLRNQANTAAFSYTAPAGGNNNPNPAGAVDARLANLFLTISGDFVAAPNLTWPTTAVPPCVTLIASSSTVGKGGSATLTFGPPAPQFTNTPLLTVPTQCTLSASDGTFSTAAQVGTSGTVSTGALTNVGTYTASLDCVGAAGDTATSLATQTITVTAQPTLTSITVTPPSPTLATGMSLGFTATGSYSDGSSQNLTGSATWRSSSSAVTITNTGVATCHSAGTSSISAMSGNVVGGTPLTCQTPAPVLQILTITPGTAQALNEGQTEQFTVTGGYSDGSTQDLTSVATWTSSVPATASVGNAATGGLVTAINSGATIIGAAYGGVSPASVNVSVNMPSATLTASPTSAAIGTNSQLSWSSAGLPPAATCSLTSNSSDAPLNVPNAGTAGTRSVTDALPQTVTYSLNCTGLAQPATATVVYTLRTTYQYTGNFFAFAFAPYTTAQRLIVSMTLDSPLPANASAINAAQLPGFQLTGSDGVHTMQPLPGNSDVAAIVSTDASGNIIGPYSVGLNNDPGPQQQGFTVQDDTTNGSSGFQGTNDISYTGTALCSASCGGNNGSPGSWTSTNIQSLHVVYGTMPAQTPPAALLYEVTIGGTSATPSLLQTSILNLAPEPGSCAAPGISAAPYTGPTALTGIAFTPNTSGGTPDLVAANASAGDVFRMTGPSYEPSFDMDNASPNCWGHGPVAAGIAADAGGNVIAVGHDIINTGTPSVYIIPNNTPGIPQNAPNFVLLDNVNSDNSLVAPSCGLSGVGCVHSLVDAVVATADTPSNGVAAGDLLILSGDASAGSTSPIVMKIPASTIQTGAAYSANCPASYGNNSSTPTPCVSSSQGAQLVTPTSLILQNTEAPVSMDLSPIDGSLLIATNQGNIYQLQATTFGYGNAQLYAVNQLNIQRIRTAQRGGVLYVFATVQGSSSIVEMFAGAPPAGGFISPLTSIPAHDVVGGLAVH
jgi:hypothetical protein